MGRGSLDAHVLQATVDVQRVEKMLHEIPETTHNDLTLPNQNPARPTDGVAFPTGTFHGPGIHTPPVVNPQARAAKEIF